MSLQQLPAFERTLAEYFRERLEEFGRQLVPSPQEDTLWYMGNMLARFGDSDKVFSYDRGEISIRPLALLYKDARQTADRWQRCQILRQLGDQALFMGALFPERYERRGILRDYFVGMGGGAYDYLAENAQGNRHIYCELAAMFARLLELVARVCAKQKPVDARDLLDLYQRWRRSRDPHLADQLRALGIALPKSDLRH
ncbi:hypothetical protein [Microbulbifer magnicolonia]|uniref:hypothetical protein n=1 Tax=Microbulbifer magnicolonia TaxID=3109744 RepID=UPI002B401570|nr:hypothetical protein [Microbulbifer sp. GG15]